MLAAIVQKGNLISVQDLPIHRHLLDTAIDTRRIVHADLERGRADAVHDSIIRVFAE